MSAETARLDDLVERAISRYDAALRGFLRWKMGVDDDEVQDALQETYEHLLRYRQSEWEDLPRALVMRIAANVVIDRARHRASRHSRQHFSVDDLDLESGEVLPATPVKLTASVRSVSVDISGQRLELTNRMAATETAVAKSSLAGIRSMEHTLSAGETITHDIEVEAGTELLVAELEMADSRDQKVALFLYDCSRKGCVTSRRLEWNGQSKRILVENPHPGKWKAQLVALGSGEARVRYSDYYTHPRLGSLTTTDSVQQRSAGAHWVVDWNAWRAGEARAGYRTAGLICLQEREGRVQHYIHETAKRSHSIPLALKPFLLD